MNQKQTFGAELSQKRSKLANQIEMAASEDRVVD